MCEYLDYEVTKLKRTRIMNVELGYLQSGDWRELTDDEMKEINKMISSSSKTEEASAVKEKPKKKISKRKRLPLKTILIKRVLHLENHLQARKKIIQVFHPRRNVGNIFWAFLYPEGIQAKVRLYFTIFFIKKNKKGFPIQSLTRNLNN